QGPMTRVSDRAEFAAAVADGGGLPFLALALMRGAEVSAVLGQTKRLMGDRPWGAGILGFVPPELRAEQLAAVREHRPPYALVAGGRPAQARALEEDGIRTYLHVPSPGLLRLYFREGARRFVFEGRECGGHVGPRTSLVLWDTMVRTLLEETGRTRDAADVHVLLAGGIHDGLSAAMAAAVAAPLAERGMRVGALVGTGYLFTHEAVACGAITPGFQEAALGCDRTVLLETGPGHATRCAASPFAEEFGAAKLRLARAGRPDRETRGALEELNLGRLRIAAKGADRNPAFDGDTSEPKLIPVDPAGQWRRGMYMIGQVAALHDEVGTVAALHEDLCRHSTELLQSLALPEAATEPAPPPADVAIVGMSCILPGAPDLATFWSNVLGGVDAVGEVPPDRFDAAAYFDPDRAAPDKSYSRWGGFIPDVPFDPVAFGMPPNSLRSIEPFQLLGLVAAKAALDDAGYAERPFPRERTSVLLGAGGGGAALGVGYTVRSTLPSLFGDSAAPVIDALDDALPEWTEDSFAGLLMNVAAGRIANRLDLGGSNATVDAACASSLAAVAGAVSELRAGTADVALAGGVDAIQTPFAYLCFAKTQALSPSGRCRPFDADADGIAISEGFACLVLKRLEDAERDGDRVYAVIRGVGAASDGRARSLTAPRPEGQMRALRRAYAHAGFSPATVGLVEAHGTGTVAGDGAEVQALTRVYADAGAGTQSVAIGSVKSMIGHTKATAGVAGLVKAALALHHGVLPPTIGVARPNPKAGFGEGPFYVNGLTRPWVHDGTDHPRRASVSAFGFGGTNFHVALEEHTGAYGVECEPGLDQWPAELFVWRAEDHEALRGAVDRVLAELDEGLEPPLTDLAYTLALDATGRAGRPAVAVVAASHAELAERLRAARAVLTGDAEREHGKPGVHVALTPLAGPAGVAFLFPGQGSQRVGMLRDLAVLFPVFRKALDQADGVLSGALERPLSTFV
ncbi:MAG: acyltransferase protein, partial [Solirubrobacterales bacterium]|nr:acyltransferase protein [Solirubrobacterales bacterium]